MVEATDQRETPQLHASGEGKDDFNRIDSELEKLKVDLEIVEKKDKVIRRERAKTPEEDVVEDNEDDVDGAAAQSGVRVMNLFVRGSQLKNLD